MQHDETFSRRRRALLQGGALAALAPQAWAQAAGYPDRPIKLLVPWPPGGGADTLARLLSQHLAKRVGQSVVVDNKPGAGGNIGAELATQAAPDGYTVLFATAATHAINPGLYASLRFKPSDFLPVGRLATITNIVVVHPDLRVKNVQELIALAKTRQVNYASAGNGSTQHLCAEMFKTMSGVDLTHVPYKGGGPAVAATIAGDTQVLFADPLASIPFIKSGKLRAIAVTGSTRLASLPDVPTVAESGIANYEALNWSGLMVPAGTPPRIVAYLNREVNAVLETPEVKGRLADQGYEAAPSTPAEFDRMVETETGRWGQIIKAARVKLD
jgi:tripartite-type tricarboxylate transporter receptor subunit TctC